MFKNLTKTMSVLTGKGAQQNNSASEVEKVIAIAFMIAYFLGSKLVSKYVGLSMPITLILMAAAVLAGAHQLDKKLPFPNKHFWKLISSVLMFIVFLMVGV